MDNVNKNLESSDVNHNNGENAIDENYQNIHTLEINPEENLNEELSGTKKVRKSKRQKNSQNASQKVDVRAKLERSRQSARECRARKKLRYQYLEDLVLKRENSNLVLKKEIEKLKGVVSLLTSNQCDLEIIEKRYREI